MSSILNCNPVLGVIVRVPSPDGVPVNCLREYPYVGFVWPIPAVVNPATVLSCHSFKTPVFWS